MLSPYFMFPATREALIAESQKRVKARMQRRAAAAAIERNFDSGFGPNVPRSVDDMLHDAHRMSELAKYSPRGMHPASLP